MNQSNREQTIQKTLTLRRIQIIPIRKSQISLTNQTCLIQTIQNSQNSQEEKIRINPNNLELIILTIRKTQISPIRTNPILTNQKNRMFLTSQMSQRSQINPTPKSPTHQPKIYIHTSI